MKSSVTQRMRELLAVALGENRKNGYCPRATAHEDVNSGSPRPTAALTRSNPHLIDMPVVLLFMLDVGFEIPSSC